MRGNETIEPPAFAEGGIVFPIPMRGNEPVAVSGLTAPPLRLGFPIPMRGNEHRFLAFYRIDAVEKLVSDPHEG